MLSRAVLPLTRPNVLASTLRVSALPVNHSRFYAKVGKPKAPYKIPENVKPSKPEQPTNSSQKEPSPEQAQPDVNTESQSSRPVSRYPLLLHA